MSTKRKFLPLLFCFLVATASVGYYFYNKGPENRTNRKTLPVSGSQLYKAYTDDSLTAQKKFSGKVLLVSGTIITIDKNQQQETILNLQTDQEGAYINCTMEEPAPGLQINDQVRIKGICSGMGQGDPDLGIKADVYLTRCQVDK